MVFNDPELIPLLSHAFMPGKNSPYQPFFSDYETADFETPPPPPHPRPQMSFGASQSPYTAASEYPATPQYANTSSQHFNRTHSTESSASSAGSKTPQQSSTDLNAGESHPSSSSAPVS